VSWVTGLALRGPTTLDSDPRPEVLQHPAGSLLVQIMDQPPPPETPGTQSSRMVPITTPRRCEATIMGSANLNLTGGLVSSVISLPYPRSEWAERHSDRSPSAPASISSTVLRTHANSASRNINSYSDSTRKRRGRLYCSMASSR
jgi:hypothetical protein